MADVTGDERALMARAVRAQALLDDGELTAAFAAVRQALFDRLEQCPIRDREGAHELRLQLHLLADVRANLHAVVNTGKVIQYRLSMLERIKRGAASLRR